MMERAREAEAWNLRLVGSTDLNGRGDAMHVNLSDGYAYIGHMGYSGVGTSIVDVRDPAQPRVVHQIPSPPGTRSHKVQVVGDLLVVNHERNPFAPGAADWQAGLQIYDISRRTEPRPIGFLPSPGVGVHRPTFWDPPYAYFSGSDVGYSDQFFIIADLTEPARPVEVGRWWLPGMYLAGGENPDWPPNERYALHHALIRGDRAYCGWWDAGLVILNISDRTRPALVCHLDFGSEVSSCTHTALPVPGKDLLVVTDEAISRDPPGTQKQVRILDISDEQNPVVLSTFPIPQGDYRERGGEFGPHNLHEMRPGTLADPDRIYLTYSNAGLRVVDIRDPRRPQEVAFYVPDAPPGRHACHTNDVLVGADGLIYITDRFAGGLSILEWAM